MPAQFEMDLSELTDPNSVLRTGDIVLPSGVTLLTDPEEMVARIEVPRGAIGAEDEDEEQAAEGDGPGEDSE